jgi:hypothetical protein
MQMSSEHAYEMYRNQALSTSIHINVLSREQGPML